MDVPIRAGVAIVRCPTAGSRWPQKLQRLVDFGVVLHVKDHLVTKGSAGRTGLRDINSVVSPL